MQIILANKLGQSFPVLVDDEDYPFLSRFTWQLSDGGYYYVKWPVNSKGKFTELYLHKIVMATHGIVDHINGDKSDCRKENLRPATYQENGWNKAKQKRGPKGEASSQYKGVIRCEGKGGRIYWRVVIKLSKKGEKPERFARLGPFASEVDAARAYNEEIVKHRGEWAWLNQLPGEAA